jgi:hypothetical protein
VRPIAVAGVDGERKSADVKGGSSTPVEFTEKSCVAFEKLHVPVPTPHIGAGEMVLEHRDKFFCRNASLSDDSGESANFDFTMIGDDAPL